MIDREPKDVWKWFEAISQIPRASGNEKKISEFCVEFAKERELDVWTDKVNNVIIHKKASPGFEDRPTVILQGHLDMVAEKSKDSNHNFEKDPIKLIVDGDFLHADHTTLGGDDGIAIAIMLAILDDDSLKHPALECVMTTAEETGMDGVLGLTDEHISGKYLLNIDSEEEGVFLAGSAGGMNVLSFFEKTEEGVTGSALHVKVSDLTGGHSGMEINKQRGNAMKILARLLYAVKLEQTMRIAHPSAGSKHNAIPLSAETILIVKDADKAKATIERVAGEILKEIEQTDKNAKITVNNFETPDKALNYAASERLVNFIFLAPHGVFGFSNDIKGLVETSSNVAMLEDMGDSFRVLTSVRGSRNSTMRYLVQQLITLTQINGGESATSDGYPVWEFEKSSDLSEIATEVYEKMFGKTPSLTAIHAGLECGIIKELLPETQMISLGPNMYDVHTENEKIDIPSTERFYKFIKKLLEELK